MSTHCADTHFYVAGHKTRSGRARYTTPDGRALAVVCGRNRPGDGEIHLRDVPNRAMLVVSGAGGELTLQLTQSFAHGQRGRDQTRDTLDGLDADARWVMLHNLAHELPAHPRTSCPPAWTNWWAAAIADAWLHQAHIRMENGQSSLRNTHELLDEWLGTNLHRHAAGHTWQTMLERCDAQGRARIARHAGRLVASLAGVDAATDRRAFRATVTEVLHIIGGTGAGDVPELISDGTIERLAACLAANPQEEALLKKFWYAGPQAYLNLVFRLSDRRGVPRARIARRAATSLSHQILFFVPGRPRAAVQCLAEPALDHLAPRAAAYIDPLMADAAYRLATPEGRAALKQRYARNAFVTAKLTAVDAASGSSGSPEPTRGSAAGPARRYGDRPRVPAALRDITNSVPDGLSGTESVHRARSTDIEAARQLETGPAGSPPRVPAARRPEPGEEPDPGEERDTIMGLLDAGVRDPRRVTELTRLGVGSAQLSAYHEVGRGAMSQVLACARVGLRAYDIAGFTTLGVHTLPDQLSYARDGIGPAQLDAFWQLGVTDDPTIRALGRAEITPGELAAFAAAGRDIAAALALRAADIDGWTCFEAAVSGVTDPAELALVDEYHPSSIAELRTLGYEGARLVAAARSYLHLKHIRELAGHGIAPDDVITAAEHGVTGSAAVEYLAAEVHEPSEWMSLTAAGVSPRHVRVYRDADVRRPAEMILFAEAGIVETRQVRAAVAAARERSARRPSLTAAAAMEDLTTGPLVRRRPPAR